MYVVTKSIQNMSNGSVFVFVLRFHMGKTAATLSIQPVRNSPVCCVAARTTSVVFSLVICCCCAVGHWSLKCCVHVYYGHLINLLVLWMCKVPVNVALLLSSLKGLVNLVLEIQDEFRPSYIAGDLLMQQQNF